MKKQVLRVIVMMLVTFLVASALVYYVFVLNEEEQEDDEDKFIGNWKFVKPEETYNENFSENWIFYENKTLKSAWTYRDGEKTGGQWANYEIFPYTKKINITFFTTSVFYNHDNMTVDYVFSNNNKKLTLIYNVGSVNEFDNVLIKQ